MSSPARPRSNRPFLAAPRTAFYHPSRAIDAARSNLERAIRRGEGIGMVVGPPGTGKSLLLALLAEQVRDDFDVALLTGARICTRRALWQSMLAEIGEPYRGIDEADLRISVLERIRGLSATGSGLVILVDEAHTLPIRLLEELRLLSNVPTPLPAVHVIIAGTTDLEERLASPRMESLSQRIAVRAYLEPLDHAETCGYLRSQCAAAAMNWDSLFEPGCDDAVFTITDGVPRLINQLCDHAVVRSQARGGHRISRGDVEEAWRQIQQLPSPAPTAPAGPPQTPSHASITDDDLPRSAIEFGSLDDDLFLRQDMPDTCGIGVAETGQAAGFDAIGLEGGPSPDDPLDATADVVTLRSPASDPWHGPEVELVFDAADDPFEEYFESEQPVVERVLVGGPEDFKQRLHVASREGADLAGRIEAWERAAEMGAAGGAERGDATDDTEDTVVDHSATDDSDMVVIDDDECVPAGGVERSVFAVRPGDYRSLFARLRRGDGADSGR